MLVVTKPRSSVRMITVARIISFSGGAAAYTALNYVIFQRTHSAVWVSASLLLTFGVSGLVGPFAGALGDKFDRQKVMIASDLVAAIFFAALAFVEAPWLLLLLAFLGAVGEAPMWSASGAAIPNLVDREDLPWANSMIQLGFNTGLMIGPAIGGALVAATGPRWVFVINAASFVISAGLMATVRRPFQGERADDEEFRGVRAGILFVLRDRVLRAMTSAWFVWVLGIGLVMVADIPFAELFDAGALGYGLMVTAWGAGSVVGSFAGRLLSERTEGRALVLGTLCVAVFMGAVAVSPWFWFVLFGIFASGLGDAFTMVAERNVVQRRTPDAVRSRVMAATEAAISIAFLVSFLIAGFVVNAVGPRWAYGVGAAGTGLAVLILLPVLRELRPSETPVSA
ncbi:MAG: MFS transporter [Actinomycetota bacterium]